MKHQKLRTVVRTTLIAAIVIALTFTTLIASDLITGELRLPSHSEGVPALEGRMHALTVRTANNADFPSAPSLTTKELRNQLDEIAEFADTYGYNAIFFEAVGECDAFYRSSILPASASWTGNEGGFTFFDPLDYLVNAAKEYQIQVYAVVSPYAVSSTPSSGSPAYQNSDWITNGYLDPTNANVQKLAGSVVEELTDNYDIAGVVLSNVDSERYATVENYEQAVLKLSEICHSAIKHKDTQRLGMVVTGGSILEENARDLFTAPIEHGSVDFVVPSFDQSPDADYAAALDAWKELCAVNSDDKKPLAFYPLHVASEALSGNYLLEGLLYYDYEAQVDGVVISNYGSLHTSDRLAAVSLAATFRQQEPSVTLDLSYSQTFHITRPAETLTVTSDTSAYFITGTSDPSQPVYYNGNEISRSDTGLWGALVNVSYGTNTYAFTQGGQTQTATIIRNQPAETTFISTISKSSAYPANPEIVLSGSELKLSCTAPAGGTVTATVGGLNATLEPVSAVSQNGIATTYQTKIDLSSIAVSGQVKNIGAVTYHLNYGGMNSSQISGGEVYLAGEGATPVVKMKTFTVPVNKNAADDGQYLTVLRQDCVDYVVENDGGNYYKLAFGGYVLKSAVEVPEGAVSAENNVSSISLERVAKGEKLTLTGTARPAFTGNFADGTVTITLQNISGFENMNTAKLESVLCSTIDSTISENNAVTLTFHLNEGVSLLGWNVEFNGTDTIIYLKEKPTLHLDSDAPLSEITVLLDPGHGGNDPGAAGVPYNEGPWEKTLNLANAYALESRLKALGATVYIAQEDASMTLNERMELAEKHDADVFISCHHNSMAETVDSNDVAGIEIYYYNNQSESFAQQIGQNLASATGRKMRFVNWSWYRVTMMTACPSVLVESGYICNPWEYEQIATEYQMFQYANAVSDAVIAYFAD